MQVPIWKKRQGVEAVPLAVRHGLARIPCWCRGNTGRVHRASTTQERSEIATRAVLVLQFGPSLIERRQ